MYYNSRIRCTNILKQNEIFHNIPYNIHNLTINFAYFQSLNTKKEHYQYKFDNALYNLAFQEGFEPPTVRLEGECSILLSY